MEMGSQPHINRKPSPGKAIAEHFGRRDTANSSNAPTTNTNPKPRSVR
jgi:hypothetical protein